MMQRAVFLAALGWLTAGCNLVVGVGADDQDRRLQVFFGEQRREEVVHAGTSIAAR